MSNGFTTYRLIDDGSAIPILDKQPVANFRNIQDGVPNGNAKVLLHSGFAWLGQESREFCSAALQLNGDLAQFSNEKLHLFAQAERTRKNDTSFSSYTIEADNRLCVISDNALSLNRFIDTYGGMLDVVPLLVKGSHPDFDTVTELSISNHEDGFLIDYSLRSAVDHNRCNYCTDCGKLCPENCISEQLFFDFEKCSFCRECEKGCAANAIDIYAVEQRDLIIPAIISLGETIVQIPEGSKQYYHETDVSTYISTLFPCQVDEVIACNPDVCQYSSRSNSGCEICLQNCAFKAISGAEKISINARNCVECGHCAGSCPTGAIQYLRFDDKAFLEFFRTFSIEKGSVAVLGTHQDLHKFWWQHRGIQFDNHIFLEYPHLNALSTFHLLFLLAHGASNVVILDTSEANKTFVKIAVDEINYLVKKFFSITSRIHLSSIANYSATVSELEQSALIDQTYTDLNYINRRDKLSAIFQHIIEQTKKTVTLKSSDTALFNNLSCNEDACTQCLACLNECNIEALSADPAALTLLWKGSLCIGCSACINVCPEDALFFSEDIVIDPLYFRPAVISQAEPMRCKECGKVFGTKKSFDRVMEILAKRNMDHDGHFEYCEDCRVIKLLESE